ncbi:MAG: glycosyltransferase family 1 protein [Caldilineales bacterium]
MAHLPAAAPDLDLTAFTPAGSVADFSGIALEHSRLQTGRPAQRILWEQTVLPVAARRHSLDLLHGAVNVTPLLGLCPTVVTIHDLSFMRYPQAFPALQRTYLRREVRRSARHARQVIAVSQATRDDVVALFGVSPARVTVVYNGVDAVFTPAPTEEVEAFRRERGLPQRFVLHLGTLEPRKNLARLVQAFAQARQRLPDADDLKLVLAGGKGWDYDDIFAAVQRERLHDHVLFPGYVADADLPWLYRAATVFTYPSLLEGFGLPVLEAMACGTPVVTSSVSSLPEVAGDAALLVDPASVDALAGALVRVLSDGTLAAEMRAKGLRQASRFSWQRTASQTADVYRAALGMSARRRTA